MVASPHCLPTTRHAPASDVAWPHQPGIRLKPETHPCPRRWNGCVKSNFRVMNGLSASSTLRAWAAAVSSRGRVVSS
jgi:hypothetical protein